MLVAVSALSVTTAVAAGLAAAGLTAAIGARFGLGAPRILFGAGCVAVLIGFAVADLTVSGLGRWWAARPIAAAAFTGLLLLSVTVLVVETLIETLDARRLAPAARAAVRDFSMALR